jgi:glycopeptide antibiotics resistance protein
MTAMVKSSVRTITVRRWVSILLLLLTTVVIAGITLSLSGKVYNKVDPEPFRDVKLLAEKLSEGPMETKIVIALIMPIVFNVLLFLPWGFLLFIVLDTPERPATQSYLLTFLFGLAFSLAVEAWQYFLPTRVTDVNDVIWNASGAVLGAILGHLRKRIRVAFE